MVFKTLKQYFSRTINKNTKRTKDNSGIGYSYGTAIATLASQKMNSAHNYKLQKSKEHPALPQPVAVQPKDEFYESESAVINNDPLDYEVDLGMVSVYPIIFYLYFFSIQCS